MQPKDIEGALAAAFTASGYAASAPPLPSGYTASLPWLLFTRTGGSIRSRVITTHSVDVDVYAGTWAAAQAAAANATAALLSMEGSMLDGDAVYTVDPGLAYTNPDPLHPNIPRVTFSVTLATRIEE